DFKEGGSQIFEALTILSPELPPIKIIVTLTSIKDEYLKIGNRKVRTENIVMKIRNYPQIYIWVAKSDKAIIKIVSPSKGVTIARIFSPYQPKPMTYPYTNDSYISNNVTFKSNGAELSGTVTIPKGEGRHPTIILVWGDGPHDRGYQGFFDSIADYLSQKGVCVLRFDKRGVGSSTGSYLSYSTADEIDDITNAAEYLASREYVDPDKIIAVGHAEGADLVLRSVSEKSKIRLLVLMSPDLFFGEKEKFEKFMRSVLPLNLKSGYSALLEQSFRETPEKTSLTKGNWALILDRRRFLADARWRSEAKPIREVVKDIKLPVLIIQGRKDEAIYPECASIIDEALQEGGNNTRVLVYYAYLGRFLGNKVVDFVHRAYYQADREMLDGIIGWINREEARGLQK
ncbi:MAG: alpha/beta fold hydrolase, partial [Candidatus Omnitrophica bacterium]|nr:alpha/beta fold hydrolase [Candidatus Omnitrophota bacterium]